MEQQEDKCFHYLIESELAFSTFYNQCVDFPSLLPKVAVAFWGGLLEAQVHSKFRRKECSKKTKPKALCVLIWTVDKTMINNKGKETIKCSKALYQHVLLSFSGDCFIVCGFRERYQPGLASGALHT